MKLTDLDAEFVQRTKDGFRKVKTKPVAQGVWFLCPKCFVENGNSAVGTHRCLCWFSGRVTEDAEPGPGRWNPSGKGLDDLTFVPPGQTSVLIRGGCNAHFFIENGEVRFT